METFKAQVDQNIEAKSLDVMSVVFGDDVREQHGPLSDRQRKLFDRVLPVIADGAWHRLVLHNKVKGDHTLYVRRTGNRFDIGTRKDFEAAGWKTICDSLDKGAADALPPLPTP